MRKRIRTHTSSTSTDAPDASDAPNAPTISEADTVADNKGITQAAAERDAFTAATDLLECTVCFDLPAGAVNQVHQRIAHLHTADTLYSANSRIFTRCTQQRLHNPAAQTLTLTSCHSVHTWAHHMLRLPCRPSGKRRRNVTKMPHVS